MAKNIEDFSSLKKVNDPSDAWRTDTNRQPLKPRWRHDREKPSVPPKPPRVRTPMPRVPQGNDSEQSGVGVGSTTVAAAQVEATQGIVRPQTSSEVPQPLQRSSKKSGQLFSGQVEMKRSNTLPRTSSHTPQPRPFPVVPTPPAEAQRNTTQPYGDGNHSTSESLVHTSTCVRSASFSSSEVWVFLVLVAHTHIISHWIARLEVLLLHRIWFISLLYVIVYV